MPPVTAETQGSARQRRPQLAPGLLLFSASVAISTIVSLILLQQPGWSREAALMAGIFSLTALLWVTEALPLFATALIAIGLQLLLLSNPGNWPRLGFSTGPSPTYREILGIAADPVLLLFFGGFLMARAAVKEGVDSAMSSLLLTPFGGRPLLLVFGLMMVTALFSMWMSNTATTAMMMTIIAPMLLQIPKDDPFRKMLVLAIPFSASIGGIATPISSPPNAVAVGFLQKEGFEISFLQWILIAMPFMLALQGFTWLVLRILFPPKTRGLHIFSHHRNLTGRGWFVVCVFVITVALWVTDQWHGLPPAVVALFPAVAFTATQLLDRNDVNRIDWNILILIAGGISLGAGMNLTGLDKTIVDWLPGAHRGALITLSVLIFGTLLVGTFMSNTAAANLLLPIGVTAAMAFGGGALVVQIGLSIAFISAVTMALPVSTPPNAMAYATGEITTKDIAIPGLTIGVFAAVLLIFGMPVALRILGIPG